MRRRNHESSQTTRSTRRSDGKRCGCIPGWLFWENLHSVGVAGNGYAALGYYQYRKKKEYAVPSTIVGPNSRDMNDCPFRCALLSAVTMPVRSPHSKSRPAPNAKSQHNHQTSSHFLSISSSRCISPKTPSPLPSSSPPPPPPHHPLLVPAPPPPCPLFLSISSYR